MYLQARNILLLILFFIFDSIILFSFAKEEPAKLLETVNIVGDSASVNMNSYYYLAVENEEKNTPNSRTLAREYLRKAIRLEPENIFYRLKLASLLETSFSTTAEDEYRFILSIDKNNIDALLGLARIVEKKFYEWLNSAKLFEENIVIMFNDDAMEDFILAEEYYKNVLSIDSLNYNANNKLAVLYESINKNDEGVFYLNRLVQNYADSFEVHLNLGLLLYKLSFNGKANYHFLTALELMSQEQKNEFTIKSVTELLDPVLEDKIEAYKQYEAEELFDYYWAASDPLHLTEYNERLIEHYARIVYSNLRFSLKDKNKSGWMTDRGEIVMRYGEPEKTMRIRPGVDWGTFNVKTEVWYYENMVLGFTDTYSSGNYVYNIPSEPTDRVRTQFAGDTFSFVNELKRKQHETYIPKYEGPSFNIDLNIAQFRNEDDNSKTDVYISYSMNDSALATIDGGLNHEYGIFFFDNYFEKLFEQKKYVDAATTDSHNPDGSFINSTCMSTEPFDGKLAFEIMREKDKGVSSNHGKFKVKNFTSKKLLVSDILFATQINLNKKNETFVNRKNVSLFVNPANQFESEDEIFIYYEVYNLPGKKNEYEFEQTFTLKNISSDEFSIGKTIGTILSFVGVKKEDQSISMSSNIKSIERDTEVYLQLDFRGYEPGEYEIALQIRDKSTGDVAETKSVLRIK